MRTVKVGLEADSAKFISGVEPAVRKTEDFSGKLRQLDMAIRRIPDVKINADTTTAEIELARIREDLRKLSHDSATIDVHVAAGEVARLRAELAALGSGPGTSLGMHLSTQQAISELDRLGKALVPKAQQVSDEVRKGLLSRLVGFGRQLGKDAATDFKGTFSDGIFGFLKSPTGLSLVIPAAIIGGEMIGGALLTGIGLSGIGLGIAGQLHDPQVQAAASKLGHDIVTDFKASTASFRDPLLQSIADADRRWKAFAPSLKATFDQLVPEIGYLERGTVQFGINLATGLEHAAIASKPLLRDFSSWLPRFGDQLGHVFDAAASHSGAALNGLHALEDTLSGIASALPPMIAVDSALGSVLSKLSTYGQLQSLYGKKVTTDARVSTLTFADALLSAALGYDKNATAADKAAAATAAFNSKVTAGVSAISRLSHATGDLIHDLNNLKGQLDKHSRSLNDATDAGHANADALRRIADEAEAARQAEIDHAGGANASKAAVDAANAKYNATIKTLEAMAIKFGLNKNAVHSLLDQWLIFAGAPNINKTVDIWNRQHYSSTGSPAGGQGQSRGSGLAFGGVTVAAADGLMTGPAGIYPPQPVGSFLFAEARTRGETLIPNYGIPAARGLALSDYAASHYGGRVVGSGGGTPVNLTVQLMAPDGRMIQQQLIRFALDTNRAPAELLSSSTR